VISANDLHLLYNGYVQVGSTWEGVLMKIGDLVRNTYEHAVIQPHGHPYTGVVMEVPKESDAYPQILVLVNGALDLWWPSTTEVVV
jgi:hypothetical protein